MTRYHVLANDELMAQPILMIPAGFRFIEPSGPSADGYSRWWLVEDPDAPAEFEQHRVEVVFICNEDGIKVTERHIVNQLGIRIKEQP